MTTAMPTTPTATTTAQTMNAIVRERYGSADTLQLRQIEVPTVGDNDILVRVRAAGLDRGAWHLMMGTPYLVRLAFGLRKPSNILLGLDMSGVIEAVGKNVSGFKPGDAVYGTAYGSFAEYVVAREGKIARLPQGVTFEQAAAVPVSAQTALQAVRDHARVKPGQRVLVIGASGGVGTFAVQIAKAFGAHVTGVCSTAKMDLVRSIGADQVIDYTRTDLGTLNEHFDAILDIGGSRPLSQLRRLLTRTGTLVIVGGEGGSAWAGTLSRQLSAMLPRPFSRQRLTTFVAGETSRDLETLNQMIEAGQIKPVIDRVCPLESLPDAMRDLEAGRVRGKVVMTVST